MRAVDALIVDFGGVLTTPLNEAMLRFATEHGIEMSDLMRVSLAAYTGGEDRLVIDFEKGHISDEDFCAAFAERLTGATGVEVQADGLVDRIFGGLQAEDLMFEAVLAARAEGFKTALLSNSWGLGLYPYDRFPELFDVVVISGEVGMRKPDPDIFLHTVEKLGVAAERCVFVDDHGGHLETAASLGMKTVLHRDPDRSITELESLLGIGLRVKD